MMSLPMLSLVTYREIARKSHNRDIYIGMRFDRLCVEDLGDITYLELTTFRHHSANEILLSLWRLTLDCCAFANIVIRVAMHTLVEMWAHSAWGVRLLALVVTLVLAVAAWC
jgi:hypothetical protein